VRRWLAEQLAPIERSGLPLAVVLDPEDALRPDDLDGLGDVEIIRGWFELRRAYEHRGRRRRGEEGRLVLVVKDPSFREARDLPFDIERASAVAVVAVPGPPTFRDLVLQLPDDLSDAAARVLERSVADPLAELIAELWRVRLAPGDPAAELELVIRLRTDPTVPLALWPMLAPRLAWEPARSLCEDPPLPHGVQRLWEGWLTEGRGSSADQIFRRVGPRIGPLFHVGLLRPAPIRAEDLPSWVQLGAAEAQPGDRLEQLLTSRPDPWPPTDLAGWCRAAEWWGEVRAALAEAGAPAAEMRIAVLAVWEELDRCFGPWLREHFGEVMTLSTPLPLTVDKIAPFLARRLRRGEAERILLVVVDGMGFAQWSTLRRTVGLSVLASAAVFAMIPTLTPISRQAIFAGCPPLAFPDTIRDTAAEERRWRDFWRSEELDVGAVGYRRVSAASPDERIGLEDARVVGLVVSAVDEILHGAHLLGDIQVTSAVRAWAEQGYLRSLLDQAVEAGYEVWITADHGNLEAEPLGRVHEGLAVEAAGVRVRWYPNASLREGARVDGIAWDPPGLPEGACYPLFAPGRGGYFSGDVRVTHGGISLDEVIVPRVRVIP
jgi:hypothetical protein